MQKKRYPKIYIRSKNELAKHISDSRLSKNEALELINDCIDNFDEYWRDNVKESEPEKEKYVRDASYKPLGKLLKKINEKVLKPYDNMIPNFIFGGITGLNHAKATKHLLGDKRKRTLLKLDISRFFEQINSRRVYFLFYEKFKCSQKASKLITHFCCLKLGPKEKPSTENSFLARGFATSPRLAIWANLDTFINLERLVKKELKGKDPRIAIYVDDIAITSSRTSKRKMKKIYNKINKLMLEDKNQLLPLNHSKKQIIKHYENPEHLGIRLMRNRLEIGSKTKGKIKNAKGKKKRKKRYYGLLNYKKYIENV